MGKSRDREVIHGKGKQAKVLSIKSIRKESPKREENDVDEEFGEWEYRLKEVRNLFLRCLAGIYFIAFLSIYMQADGLYGTNGVHPVKAELNLAKRSPQECMKEKYSLLCLIPKFFGINGQYALELVALLGVVISALGAMCAHVCTIPVMVILWGLYFSIYQIGNIFLWFQWDILLLETGVLGIIAAPWLPTKSGMGNKPRDLISMWMVKWLLFRLMFASGVVKLQSGCPTWWGLTALNYHFESQCLPTPLAYFVHQFPSWLLHLMVVGTYYVEIVLPIAFFAPFKQLKRYAFWTQVLFQIAIFVTGNYTFFNLLTMVLCVSLLDAEFFGIRSPYEKGYTTKLFSRMLSHIFIGCSLFYTYKFFGLSFNTDKTIASKINFTRVEFDWFVSIAVPYTAMIGLVTLGSSIAQSVVISLFDKKGCWNKLTSFVSCVFYAVICFALFSVTLVPFTSLHKETNRSLYEPMREMHSKLSKYHIANSYGLFRHMTGVEKGRPEVILEYANDLAGPWKEYDFLYKPGRLNSAPLIMAPHQPRIDWQMWFAALGTYHDNPWLVSLTYRLLQGEKSVVKLLDTSNAPLVTPKYIRASLYHYKFTKQSSPAAAKGDWWERKREQEYMPIFSKDHEPLVEFVRKMGHLEQDVQIEESGKMITSVLDSIRQIVEKNRPEHVIWGSIIALLAIIFTSKLVK